MRDGELVNWYGCLINGIFGEFELYHYGYMVYHCV